MKKDVEFFQWVSRITVGVLLGQAAFAGIAYVLSNWS